MRRRGTGFTPCHTTGTGLLRSKCLAIFGHVFSGSMLTAAPLAALVRGRRGNVATVDAISVTAPMIGETSNDDPSVSTSHDQTDPSATIARR